MIKMLCIRAFDRDPRVSVHSCLRRRASAEVQQAPLVDVRAMGLKARSACAKKREETNLFVVLV